MWIQYKDGERVRWSWSEKDIKISTEAQWVCNYEK